MIPAVLSSDKERMGAGHTTANDPVAWRQPWATGTPSQGVTDRELVSIAVSKKISSVPLALVRTRPTQHRQNTRHPYCTSCGAWPDVRRNGMSAGPSECIKIEELGTSPPWCGVPAMCSYQAGLKVAQVLMKGPYCSSVRT